MLSCQYARSQWIIGTNTDSFTGTERKQLVFNIPGNQVEFGLHSIEQPIRQGFWDEMTNLCASSPLPIALDEELIGINEIKEKEKLLKTIRPQFIILKPSLLGGFKASEEWIDLAEKNNISPASCIL